MIFENTSFKMSLQFLILSAIYGFLAPVFNAIPFIYYRADLQCKIGEEWQPCQEQDICQNGYEFQYVNKKGIESLSMDYNLVCQGRLQEATVISVAFFGQLIAYVVAILVEVPKNKKTGVLALLFIVEGLLLNSVDFIRDNLTWVTIVLFSWNFAFSYTYSQIFSYSAEVYTPSIQTKSVSFLNITWTGGALLYIFYSQIIGNWINHVAYFSGATLWILGVLFYLLRSPPYQPESLSNPLLDDKKSFHSSKSDKDIAKEQQKNFIEDLIQKFKELKGNKKFLLNAFIFTMAWTVFQTSYSTPFIAFNSLGGDLQQNVFVSVMFDFIGSFIAYYLLLRHDSLRLLLNNILIIGVIQTSAIFIPSDSFTLQLIPILATKLSTRIGYPTLITLLAFIIPSKFNQLVFNFANLVPIIFSTLLPFYRYFMELHGLNIFFGIGVMSLMFLPLGLQFRTLDDSGEIKTARQSMKKRSSVGQLRKKSEVILDQLLENPSLIVCNATQMILDKQTPTEEKYQQLLSKANYANNSNSKSNNNNLIELPTISDV